MGVLTRTEPWEREREFAACVRAAAKPTTKGGTALAVITKAQREERDRVIAQAVADGKTTAERAHVYRAAWDKNPARTTATLAQLTPVLVYARKPAADPARAQVARGLEAAGVRARDAEHEPPAVSAVDAQVRAGLEAAGVRPRKEEEKR